MLDALILTLIIELSILFILRFKDYKLYILSSIINIITNLSLNFYLENTIFKTLTIYVIVVIILEITVLFIETLLYMIYFKKFKKSFLISLLLNASSFLLGLLIYAMI